MNGKEQVIPKTQQRTKKRRTIQWYHCIGGRRGSGDCNSSEQKEMNRIGARVRRKNDERQVKRNKNLVWRDLWCPVCVFGVFTSFAPPPFFFQLALLIPWHSLRNFSAFFDHSFYIEWVVKNWIFFCVRLIFGLDEGMHFLNFFCLLLLIGIETQ